MAQVWLKHYVNSGNNGNYIIKNGKLQNGYSFSDSSNITYNQSGVTVPTYQTQVTGSQCYAKNEITNITLAYNAIGYSQYLKNIFNISLKFPKAKTGNIYATGFVCLIGSYASDHINYGGYSYFMNIGTQEKYLNNFTDTLIMNIENASEIQFVALKSVNTYSYVWNNASISVYIKDLYIKK